MPSRDIGAGLQNKNKYRNGSSQYSAYVERKSVLPYLVLV